MALEKQNSQRYIYLADDDPDDRELFVEALQEADPSVIITQAEDGMQLMQIIDTITEPLPEVLFLDINMPGMSGFECLEKIRRQEGNIRKINIIILSTSNDPTVIEKALELGATFYAVKPNKFDVLRTFVKDVLQTDWQLTQKKNFRLI